MFSAQEKDLWRKASWDEGGTEEMTKRRRKEKEKEGSLMKNGTEY